MSSAPSPRSAAPVRARPAEDPLTPGRRLRAIALIPLLAAAGSLVGCGDDHATTDGGAETGMSNGSSGTGDPTPSLDSPAARGIEPWHDDFPIQLELPPSTGKWYARTHKQVVEKVLANLSGGYGKEAWTVALEFFRDVDDDTARQLVEISDRAAQSPTQSDLLENLLAAFGRAENPLLAPAILRALDHEKQSVRDAAMNALASSGTPDAVRTAWQHVMRVGGRGIVGWVVAAMAHLEAAELVSPLREILGNRQFGPVREQVVEKLRGGDPEFVLEVLEPSWDKASAATRVLIAGLRHRAGREDGFAYLAVALRGDDVGLRRQALVAMRGGEIGPFRDDLMALTMAGDPVVRGIAVQTLAGLEGEQVDSALESLSQDPAPQVRRAALLELTRRGRTEVHEDLMKEARTATGTKFGRIVDDLAAAEYAPVIDLLTERYDDAEPAEKKEYLRWVSFSKQPEGFDLFRRVFLEEERAFDTSPTSIANSSVAFAALYLGNLVGSEMRLFDLFDQIDRGDYRRRALMLRTIGEVGHSGRDGRNVDEYRERAKALMRRVALDRTEIPQMRLHALELWRGWMGVEDVLAVAASLEEEEPAMRQLLSDFLFETF